MATKKDLITAENVKLSIVNSQKYVTGKDIALFLFTPILAVGIDLAVNSGHYTFHFFSLLSLVVWVAFIVWGLKIYFKIENKVKIPNYTYSLLIAHSCGVGIIAGLSVAINSLFLIDDITILLLGLLLIVVVAIALIKLGMWVVNYHIYKQHNYTAHKKQKKQKVMPSFFAQSMTAISIVVGMIGGRAIMSNIPTELTNSHPFTFGMGMVIHVFCTFGASTCYYRVYLTRKFKLSHVELESRDYTSTYI